jgi:flap endonuclease-1
MGIRSLTSLIKQKSPNSIQTTALYTLKGKKVAIDASIFLYKSLANVRSNGDYLKNKDGKIVSHIIGILNKTMQYITLGITPIYIFDGKPPIEKKIVLDERNKKANESKLLSEQSESIEEKMKHEKNSIRIKKYHVDDLKQLLNLMGVAYIHPNGEAEAYASELCRIGYVDYVITEDMDTLVYGCPKMIRNCLDKSIKRRDVVSVFDLDTILKDFNMNMKEFVDMCIICGCDYCTTIPKVGTIRAFNYIQKHKTIDSFIESKQCSNIPQEFIDKYIKARELFDIFKNTIKIEDIPVYNSVYRHKELYFYLFNECGMSERKIKIICNKLNLSNLSN